MPVESPAALYGLPLEQFIPERAALAKALRSEKRRDEAAEVGSLRKPSVAAWAVNQLVRTQKRPIAELFAAGDDLVRAQADAGTGRAAGDAMRAATRRQREALHELMRAAEGLLRADGHPLAAATLERVGETLRAAAIDAGARAEVEDGCLAREIRFAGIGGGMAAAGTRSETDADADAGAEAGAERARAEAERRREAELTTARSAHDEARQRATRAEKELAAAQRRREDAAAALEEADRLVAAARERADAAAAELETAARAVSDLEEA